MNIDKLVEAIQIIVKEEVKKQLPQIMKEVKGEIRKSKIQSIKENSKPIVENQPIKNTHTPSNKRVSIPDILNETARSYAGAPSENGYEEWPTMSNPSMVNAVASNGGGVDRASLAAKMGYGDLGGGGASPTGLGVDVGNPALNKALNRDYTELVRAMNKKRDG